LVKEFPFLLSQKFRRDEAAVLPLRAKRITELCEVPARAAMARELSVVDESRRLTSPT